MITCCKTSSWNYYQLIFQPVDGGYDHWQDTRKLTFDKKWVCLNLCDCRWGEHSARALSSAVEQQYGLTDHGWQQMSGPAVGTALNIGCPSSAVPHWWVSSNDISHCYQRKNSRILMWVNIFRFADEFSILVQLQSPQREDRSVLTVLAFDNRVLLQLRISPRAVVFKGPQQQHYEWVQHVHNML